MTASILIFGFSLILLAYWFRASCLLLLRNNSGKYRVLDPRFGFHGIKDRLQAGADPEAMHEVLARDYRLLTYLLGHAAALSLDSLEDRLLVLDYKVMQWYYRLTKSAAPEHARRALLEMAAVVGVLAQHVGEQAGVEYQA